jgi:hypothetical protein
MHSVLVCMQGSLLPGRFCSVANSLLIVFGQASQRSTNLDRIICSGRTFRTFFDVPQLFLVIWQHCFLQNSGALKYYALLRGGFHGLAHLLFTRTAGLKHDLVSYNSILLRIHIYKFNVDVMNLI